VALQHTEYDSVELEISPPVFLILVKEQGNKPFNVNNAREVQQIPSTFHYRCPVNPLCARAAVALVVVHLRRANK